MPNIIIPGQTPNWSFKEINKESELRRKAKVRVPKPAERESWAQESKRVTDPVVLASYEGSFCTFCKQVLGPDRVVMRLRGSKNIRAHYHKTCAAKMQKLSERISARILGGKFYSAQRPETKKLSDPPQNPQSSDDNTENTEL